MTLACVVSMRILICFFALLAGICSASLLASRRELRGQLKVDIAVKKEPHDMVTLPRNLLVFFDGTGLDLNRSCDFREDSYCESSIVDLWRQTTGVDDKQLTFYMSGLGKSTIVDSKNVYSEFHVMGFEDKVFGKSVDERAYVIYNKISELYQPGDNLFLFGHSRGTISARILQGIIHRVGIAKSGKAEEALKANKKDSTAAAFKMSADAWQDSDKVKFMGLFEAVLRTLYFKNMERLHLEISPAVKTLAHAMALGEWRKIYEVNELVVPSSTQAMQVWFMGQHGNLGGNVEDNGIKDIPKGWMVDRAMVSGMRMPKGWESRLIQNVQADLRDNRPVSGIDSTGWAFRNPNHCRQQTNLGGTPVKVHKSVQDRMRLVSGWAPPQWCCNDFLFANHIEWVSHAAYDVVEQDSIRSVPQWVRVVLGEFKMGASKQDEQLRCPAYYVKMHMWHSSKMLPKLHGSATNWKHTTGDKNLKYPKIFEPALIGYSKGLVVKRSTPNRSVATCDFALQGTKWMPAASSSSDGFLVEVFGEHSGGGGLIGRFLLRYDDPTATMLKDRDMDLDAGNPTLAAMLDIHTGDEPVKKNLADQLHSNTTLPAQCTWLLANLLHRSESHMCKPVFSDCGRFIKDITAGSRMR